MPPLVPQNRLPAAATNLLPSAEQAIAPQLFEGAPVWVQLCPRPQDSDPTERNIPAITRVLGRCLPMSFC